PRDGRIAYQVKSPRKGRTHRVMTPMDFMARRAAVVPAPFLPLVRNHGVLASRSSWRSLVTPKPKAHATTRTPGAPRAGAPGATAPAPPPEVPPAPPLSPPPPPPAPPATSEPWVSAGSGKLPATGPAEPVATVEATTISVKHGGRLDDGELFARSRYVVWAV